MGEKRKMQQKSLVHEEAATYEIAPRTKNGHRANDLDGKTWTKYSISIWSDIKKTREEQQLGHPAMFPLQLAQRLIECFTTEQDSLIVDPFVGVGTTVIAADRMNKTGIGIDLTQIYRNCLAAPGAARIVCDKTPRQ